MLFYYFMEDKSYYAFFSLLQKDIEGINDFTAHYVNMNCVLKNKYIGKREIEENEKIIIESLDEEEKKQILTVTQSVRHFASRIYTKFSSLKHRIPQIEENFDELNELNKKIENELVPSIKTIQNFAIITNKCLIDSILNNLLMQSNEYMQQYNQTPDSFES
jgi:hypothetical protein